MAGGWSQPELCGLGQTYGSTTASSKGTNITTGAANTKGSWVQIISATTNDISRLLVQIDTYNAGGKEIAFDLAVAASGNEANGIVMQNVVVDMHGQMVCFFDLPVAIKSGSRIAARCASTTATDNFNVQVTGFDAGYTGQVSVVSVDTYGWAGTGTITGTSVDPGATANTKGAYTQMTASTTNDYYGFFLGYDGRSDSPSAGSDGHMLLDFAIGSSGSEVILVPNLAISKNNFTGGYLLGPNFTPTIYVPIKAGTRVAVRMQSASNTATDRLLGVSLYGLRL